MEQSAKTEQKQSKTDHLFKKGQSGNPNGRPPGSGISITTEIKRRLSQFSDPEKKRTNLQLLLDRIMQKAIDDGDANTIKQIWNYVDGMPLQSIDMGAKEDIKEINVKIIKNGDRSNQDIPKES